MVSEELARLAGLVCGRTPSAGLVDGYGALLLGQRPGAQRVPVVVSSRPPLWTSVDRRNPDAFDSADDYRAHDVWAGREHLSGTTVRIDCGLDDVFCPAVRSYVRGTDPRPSDTFVAGGHDDAFWSRMAPAQLRCRGRAPPRVEPTGRMAGMVAPRILVVEDSVAIRVAVETALTAQGYAVTALPDGSDLEAALQSPSPDLVVLDVMLPGRDGFALLGVIRRLSTAAVVMLTARDTTGDRVAGLLAGADDYLVKPFALAELMARIQTVLRRTRPALPSVVIGDLEVAEGADTVTRGGQTIDLTATERSLLDYLVGQRGRVVSKAQILTAVWGYGFDDNVVEVQVSGLRRKLETEGPRLLHTVRGRGYRLSVEP